ncbi:acyl-CoA dehydrogenase family protein [Gordonia soli]|uniref:Putative oxidoreductase n=1 Tax=Gordonia soli NBRC 108243 TaxID=1223545 RepID=M0QKZ1_9ACTN|nr:acyl-CoA dehydrogenase family protein [Gordonia soli]GAC69228.1 putative oxidoreductase [Gordonia soli NBRC 108243]
MTYNEAAFAAGFADYLREIAPGTVERERKRELPHQQIRDLFALGFGTLRLPSQWGGFGWDLPRALDAVIDLAAADPHVAHALRGHFNVIEDSRLAAPDHHPDLIARLAAGDLVGTAYSERKLAPEQDARLELREGVYHLSGVKYYTTGSVYADWIVAAGRDVETGKQINVIVDAHESGVEIVDDWDGFGQTLTGSGTTRFTDVPVAYRNHVDAGSELTPAHSHQIAFLQVYLLSVIAGISAAVARDAVEYVRPRKRTFGVGSIAEPRRNPLVQEVVGELHGIAQSVRSIVLEEARQLDALQVLLHDNTIDDSAKSAAAGERLIRVYSIQSPVIDLALRGATRLFDVGGASATSVDLVLDRHWRNIRTIGAHNPAGQRLQQVGNFRLNGILPPSLGGLEPGDIGIIATTPDLSTSTEGVVR